MSRNLNSSKASEMSDKPESSISTKKGDEGNTSLLDGTRVAKFSLRPEAYGAIDEANAFIGALRALSTVKRIKELLITIQNHIYYINSELACPPDKYSLLKRKINEGDTHFLDQNIVSLEAELKLPRQFVLYGGTVSSAYADIARSIIRRAERKVVKLDHEEPLPNAVIKQYLNRLSDLLFLIARLEENEAGVKPLHPSID
ncbi:cob(I)yrinic acid a,c-diamide adenosyltransferase [candidate division CSSED10-310 bacterium]|uniref:Corrinoid adenosyltransferase n=1 Tax=candidate division CSSED10-310 bacterium TaxID=2855610 RepID=A0ABV6YRC3_UNCC1